MTKNIIRVIPAIILFIILSGKLLAQHNKNIYAFFTQDSILLEPGKTFSNTLRIQNSQAKNITIENVRPAKSYPNMLFFPGFRGNVDAGQALNLQTKMIAGTELLMSGENYIDFIVDYTTTGQFKDTLHARYYLSKENQDYIAIISSGIDNFYNPEARENTVSFFIENPGYDIKNLRLNLTLSPSQNLVIRQQSINVILQPRERKLVKIDLQQKGNTTFFTDYSLSVMAYELAKDRLIANSNIPIRTLTSNRQILQNNFLNTRTNFIEAAYNRLNKSNDIYRLRGNVQQQIASNVAMEFNTVTDYFSQYKYVNIYDTRLTLRSKKMLAELGNIYGSDYDFNMNGRGLKLGYTVTGNSSIEVLGIDNNYMLYSSLDNIVDFGKTIGTKYLRSMRNGSPAQVNYLYNTNPLLNTKTHLGSFSTSFKIDSASRVKIEGGVSHEASLGIESSKGFANAGFAGGISYETIGEKISLFSNNYFSSPYYAGLRRGLLSLDEAVTYRLTQQKSLLFKYSGLINKPKYVDAHFIYHPSQLMIYESSFVNHTIEAGFNNYTDGFSYSVLPNYTYQYINNSYLNVDYRAYRLKFDVSKSFSKHYLNFIADGGISFINQNKDPFYAARFLLSYRLGMFNVNALADINPVNAYDLINAQKKNFRNYSLNTNYNYATRDQKLKGNISGGISYVNSYNGFNQFVNNQLEYRIAKDWFATANVFFTRYSKNINTHTYNNTQFQVGIKKIFGTLSSPNSSKVSFRVFEDQNQNNILDGDEKVLDNVLVNLNEHVAITDKKGFVKFANLPKQEYNIVVKKNGQTLSLLSNNKVLISKNKKYELPVVKVNTVTGKMIETKKKYDVEQTDVSGISIYAENLSTKEITTTVTDWGGGFMLHLREGNYRIYILNNRYEIANNAQNITVKNNVPTKEVNFNYINTEVEIRVKKF